MSLWNRVQQLTGENKEAMHQVQSAYGGHFPIEVRHFCAQWIESQNWSEVDEDSMDHEMRANELKNQLLYQLEDKARELGTDDMFLNKLKLQETAHHFREIYDNHPMSLVRVIKNCLTTEARIVQEAQNEQMSSNSSNPGGQQILERLQNLNQFTMATENDVRQLHRMQESFNIQCQESHNVAAKLSELASQMNGQLKLENERRLTQQKQQIDQTLAQEAQQMRFLKQKLHEKFTETVKMLSVLCNHLTNEQIPQFVRQQQLSGNGAMFDGSLETLQQWSETLAQLIWNNRQQIRNVEFICQNLLVDPFGNKSDDVAVLATEFEKLLEELVKHTFIIEKHPPQVLKTGSRFTATVRLLVGGKLNLHMSPPRVEASIISEEQARSVLRTGGNVKKENSGEILNRVGTMEYHQANGQLSVTFRNMVLKKIRRAEKKGNETVTEEKFCVFFESDISVGGLQRPVPVCTQSLPVVVTVHGNQECNAVATVLWDNAFAEIRREPFKVPDKVPFHELAQALNTRFASSCGSDLSQENLSYLASKLPIRSDEMVSWAQFNREPLPGRNFTFWEWFYSILKLTKDWLSGPWKDRLIIGFVSKQIAQDWLMMCPNFTFLLRFSDSELGGITIAWVTEDPKKPGERQVYNLAPFTDKDFKIRSLGDRVKDLSNLQFLYPDIPKSIAFDKFWTKTSDSFPVGNGSYVPADIATVIHTSLLTQPAAMYEDPRTPQLMPHSPASSDMLHSPPTPQNTAMAGHVAQHNQPSNLEDILGSDFGPNISMMDYNPQDIEDIEKLNMHELLNLTSDGQWPTQPSETH